VQAHVASDGGREREGAILKVEEGSCSDESGQCVKKNGMFSTGPFYISPRSHFQNNMSSGFLTFY
jgi:hypothetical protein